MTSADQSGAPARPRFINGLSEIATDFDVILCDVWGVIHNGTRQFAAATDALRRFREMGGRVILITNAPRQRERVMTFLDGLSVPRDSYDGLVTSGDVTISMIREREGQPLAYIGPPEDRVLFDVAQTAMREKLRFVPFEEAKYVVCIGLEHAERETPADYEARFRILRARDADFICANPDIVVETGNKLVYCAGALAELYEALGGRVIQAGKPYAEIYRRALALGQHHGMPRSHRVLAIGDSMHTDIKGGEAEGFATLFVTSGIHRAQLHADAGDGALNRGALHQFIDGLDFTPTAVAPELTW